MAAEEQKLTLCVTCGPQRVLLTVSSASQTTVAQLLQQARVALQQKNNDATTTNKEEEEAEEPDEWYLSVPRRRLETSDLSVLAAGLRHQDRIERVIPASSQKNQAKATKKRSPPKAKRALAVSPSHRATRKRRHVGGTSNVSGAASIEEALVASAPKWRAAVHSAYAQNQAVARVAAARVAVIEPLSNDPSPPQLRVTYPRGIQGRGVYVEVVDALPLDVLTATLAALHPAEALRDLALFSPRVYWSLIQAFRAASNHDTTNVEEEDDIVRAALPWACPQCDWSYLRRRPEKLSAKALENQRQKEAAANKNTNVDWEAAAAAIADVETAMDQYTEPTANTSSSLDNDDAENWTLVMPTDERRDELRACLKENDATKAQIAAWCTHLIQQCHICNAWQLAAADAEDRVLATIIDTDVAQSWIDRAQQMVLEPLMLQLCHGDAAAVHAVRDRVRSGTPRDLAVWESIPHVLCAQLSSSDDDDNETVVYEERTVQQWCRRARWAMEQCAWLADYVTPIEGGADDDDDDDDASS